MTTRTRAGVPVARIASSTASVPPRLTSHVAAGSAKERPTDEAPARCAIAVGRDGADDLRDRRGVADLPRRGRATPGHHGVLAAGPDEGVDLMAP